MSTVIASIALVLAIAAFIGFCWWADQHGVK